MSGSIEVWVRETIEPRRTRAEFIARGLASHEEAKSKDPRGPVTLQERQTP